jgi:hypothetical protein
VTRPSDHNIDEARSHLGAALMQVLPNDEPIIVEHIVQAYRALGGDPMQFYNYRQLVSLVKAQG